MHLTTNVLSKAPCSGPGPHAVHCTLSVRQRGLLHGLLHRDLRGCTMARLAACHRAGWTMGASTNHQLTIRGRQLAELSEDALPNRELAVDLP